MSVLNNKDWRDTVDRDLPQPPIQARQLGTREHEYLDRVYSVGDVDQYAREKAENLGKMFRQLAHAIIELSPKSKETNRAIVSLDEAWVWVKASIERHS